MLANAPAGSSSAPLGRHLPVASASSSVTVLAINLIGDGLRDIRSRPLDPGKLKRS